MYSNYPELPGKYTAFSDCIAMAIAEAKYFSRPVPIARVAGGYVIVGQNVAAEVIAWAYRDGSVHYA
jgi:hypothetical protein